MTVRISIKIVCAGSFIENRLSADNDLSIGFGYRESLPAPLPNLSNHDSHLPRTRKRRGIVGSIEYCAPVAAAVDKQYRLQVSNHVVVICHRQHLLMKNV
jgi:hypothetical protein